jgi:hypothetical protein
MQIDSSSFKKLSQKEKDRRYKTDLYLYCGGENHQARDCLIKASTSKLHKVRSISMSHQSKVEDAKLENEDVQPQ